MKVFLTGATGYIGTAVAERLRAAGHELSGLARSDQAASKLRAAGVTPIRGDCTNPAAVADAARSADAAISMATTYDPKVDAPAVDAILDALAGSDKPFVYTSGIWVNGDTGGIVVDETTTPEPVELVAWRKAVEDRVLQAAKRGVRSVVIRPAIVYGRGGGIPAGFRDSARKQGAARFVGTGENRWPMVHVDDLADPASRGAGLGGNTAEWPIEQAREELGDAYADALVLDQQASGRRAQELLGWRPHRPGPIEDLESGSYAKGR